ncbi:MAG: phosphomannomutase/phosphoglucomutase [Parcubacteria group bacterium]|nr:phosphomannomutase/phosphoglucomutase [Parcubacteria group bacterium]
MFNPQSFRAYDIRGMYPADLDEDTAYQVGLAYGHFLPGARRIVIGGDYRASTPALKGSLIQGLLDAGKEVTDIGTLPTPLIYFAIVHYKFDGGVVVTASHNPKEYNGIKLKREHAIPITGETGIYVIRDQIAGGKTPPPIARKGTLVSFDRDAIADYIDFVAGSIKLTRPLSIVLDIGNGATGFIPRAIFERLGCRVEALYETPDGSFPNHIADPHDHKTLVALQKRVVEVHADLGFAYDGDGDRVGMVTDKGEIVSGDHLMLLLARQALARKKGTIVFDVRISDAVVEDIKAHGGIPVLAPAGHGYILQAVKREGALIGGEITGHIFFPYCYYEYDDGIFASLKLAEVVASLSEPLSSQLAKLSHYAASPEIILEVSESEKFALVDRFVKLVKARGLPVLDIDGARITFPNGWGLVRASNTAPQIKARFEGKTNDDLHDIVRHTEALMRETGFVVDLFSSLSS